MTESKKVIKNIAYALIGLAFMSLYMGNEMLAILSVASALACALILSKNEKE